MISERDLAEKFTVIWKQSFPLLTSNFMRVFNEGQVEKINTNEIIVKPGVKYDLVSEMAFNLVKYSFEKNNIISEVLGVEKVKKELLKKTAKSIWRSGNYSEKDLALTKIEESEIHQISQNIMEFIQKLKAQEILFSPKLKGYGFLQNVIADLSLDDTLFEIKTVSRNFRSSDLKQLLLYLSLKQVSKEKMWKYGGLYNPRKGTYCKFNITSLVYNLSGGKSSIEVFEGLLNSLNRDIEIDSKF